MIGPRRFGESYHQSAPPHNPQEVDCGGESEVYAHPKVHTLVRAVVPAEATPTYCALVDYSDNRTGQCWPQMATLAKTLGRSVRTIQRHLHLLRQKGLVAFVERRRNRRRFSSYLYTILHVSLFRTSTTGHGRSAVKQHSINKEHKRSFNGSQNTQESREEQRKREAARRTEVPLRWSSGC